MGSSGCDSRAPSAPRPASAPVPVEAAPRSLLFVPGDSERKLARALEAGADALILDLEDSVAPARKPAARGLVAEFLAAQRSRDGGREDAGVEPALWVRINPLASPDGGQDLAAVVAHRPRGLVVPKLCAADLGPVAAALDVLERRLGFDAGAIRLLPISTETPASLFSLGGYAQSGPRLAGLTWGAEDLSAALGAATAVDEDGAWLPVYALARSLCLLAARAAGVAAIDTVYTDFRDAEGLRRQTLAARRDGFDGKLAIHPDQVGVIHAAFRPSAAEVEAARRVVAAFEGGDGGAAGVDGRMVDRPHLQRARQVLARVVDSETGTERAGGAARPGGPGKEVTA